LGGSHAAIHVPAVRRRPARVYRQRFRDDGGAADPRNRRPALAADVGARSGGRAGTTGDDAAQGWHQDAAASSVRAGPLNRSSSAENVPRNGCDREACIRIIGVASVWASRFVAAVLYGIEPRDPTTLAASILVLIAVA